MLQNEIMCQKFVLTQNPLAEEEQAEFVLYPASPYYILQFAAIRVSACTRLKYFGGISIFPLHPLQGGSLYLVYLCHFDLISGLKAIKHVKKPFWLCSK